MAQCSIDGCDGEAKTRGWCQAHYMRWFMKGDTGSADIVRRPKGRTCSLDGCDRPHQGRGFCDTHLQRFIKYGDPGPAAIEARNPGAKCSIDGCVRPASARGWCNAHYLRWRKTGDPLTPLPERGPRWLGAEASYNAVHLRLRAERGPATSHECARCGARADEWAFDHSDMNAKVDDLGRAYSTDLSTYLALCRSCHRSLDAKRTIGCGVLGCDRPHKARGFCDRHYRKMLAAERASSPS